MKRRRRGRKQRRDPAARGAPRPRGRRRCGARAEGGWVWGCPPERRNCVEVCDFGSSTHAGLATCFMIKMDEVTRLDLCCWFFLIHRRENARGTTATASADAQNTMQTIP